MKRWIIGGAAVLAVAAVGATGWDMMATNTPGFTLASNGSEGGGRLVAVGLTADQQLVAFRVSAPDRGSALGRVNGLQGDASLVGIDYRVQDGRLYGVGNAGGVYTLSTDDAKATKVSQLTVALNGTSFGVDFNPAADRLRVVSDTGQNLRHNVNAGGTTVADTGLNTPPAATPTTGVTAVAYTNNDLNPNTATALYDLDTAADQVSLQAPANSGQLSPIGKLDVDAATTAGFDIYSRLRSGRAVDAAGFAVLSVDGRSSIFSVSLITGQTERLGNLPRGWQVTDLAIPLDQK